MHFLLNQVQICFSHLLVWKPWGTLEPSLQTTLTIHIGLELYIILRQKMIQVKSGQIIKARTNLNFSFLYA